MTTPTRGLNFVHYMEMVPTAIVRGSIDPGAEVSPAEYYENEQTYAVTIEAEDTYDFVYSNVPTALGDVLITVKSVGCYNLCDDGIRIYWEEMSVPLGPPWAFSPWYCPAPCDDDDVCRPDDCSEHTKTYTIPREEWINNFDNIIGVYIGYPFTSCGCGDRYITFTIRFLSKAAVHLPNVYTQDLTFAPYHGWATHHKSVCGELPGILSTAIAEDRVDPHDGRMVCHHEWAPGDDAEDKRYAQGGLCGINQRPDNAEELGDLSHGSVIKQRIDGMLVRVWPDTICAQD